MVSFRGDAHKFYLKVKKTVQQDQSLYKLPEIQEIQTIDHFYGQLSMNELNMMRYWMLKEKGGNGVIPILITALPWLGFLLSKQLQTLLMKSNLYVLGFLILYIVITAISIVIHYREKAWATMHIEIIDQHLQRLKN
ncbi:hypothetical protein JOD43_004110 [Pullulanibacillus pueri]|uniref:Uncharacterized protein n=1 Tax=Pullulanibacillus pueri TaxID=1437324 RepID=A0A8J2ZZQ1_9BACL|nr:hypothetical protein [Pullulanibacillus pueri]MBM7683914.1 hypothetical protein [Pullulanibacillus pueri]GGH87791.1 hypothetical protein GCM10007096_38620 [Pullulanibacillus pueri]